jgi:hypothetical protein
VRRHSFIKQAGNRSDSILRLSLESPVVIPILGVARRLLLIVDCGK